MPRNKRQFSFLERALKVAGTTPTAGSTLDNYLKFKSGINKRNGGGIPADARIRLGYSIVPFGGPNADKATTPDKRYVTTISKFSNTFRTTAGLSNAVIGYDKVDPLNQRAANFYPAQMKVHVPEANTALVEKTSGITKRKYKTRAGKSYTIPFGAVVTKDTANEYREQMALLSEKAKSAGAKSISFVPEEWTSPTKEAAPGE